MARLSASPEERFWSHVHKTHSCWLWTGTCTRTGHGVYHAHGKTMLASRASWILSCGEILNGFLVCHRCTNKACVRPSHLYLGTHRDNGQDGNRIPYGTGADRAPKRHHPTTLAEAFWSHVSRGEPESCWPWQGAVGSNDGYGQLKFRRKKYSAHRLAYLLATGDTAEGQIIRHICPGGGTRHCVNPAHLTTGTHQDNMRDMTQHGRQARGTRIRQAKLTDTEVLRIRELAKTQSAESIAPLFCISNVMTRKIIDGIWWKHLLPPDYAIPPRHSKGELARHAKLTAEDVQHIRVLVTTHSQHEIARMFCVSAQTINNIIHHKNWKHVP